jgi:predicted nucleic acid-binding protein
MILADSSVWIDHLRRPNAEMQRLLQAGLVSCHPFVMGELACGHLRKRQQFIAELRELPTTPATTHEEAMAFVERHALMGRGIGWADVHLLASTALVHGGRLWTADKRLAASAGMLGLLHTIVLH